MNNEYDYQNLDALFGDYKQRSQETLNELDLQKLSEISKKPLSALEPHDLLAIGFRKQSDPEFPELFSIENLDMLKLYVTKEDGMFNLRGFKLRLIKPITSTEELIKETLIDWKLKMK